MTYTISLEIETALREIAARQGTTPEDVLTQTLEKTFLSPESHRETQQPPETEPVRTLAEALAGHIGTQHSGRGDLSQNTGKAFAKLMVEKRKAGRL